MALRHTSVKKNKTDHVESTPTIRLHDIVAFMAVVIDPEIMKPFLATKGHSEQDAEKMLRSVGQIVVVANRALDGALHES